MNKPRPFYRCQTCQYESLRWLGQCPECQAWNGFLEVIDSDFLIQDKEKRPGITRRGYASKANVTPEFVELQEISLGKLSRSSTGLLELDRVLGGGVVRGSVVLLGGNPGIGKSTLLMQMISTLNTQMSCLYVTGEESLQQIAMRAKRLDCSAKCLKIFTETRIDTILAQATHHNVQLLVIDSIQTMYTDILNSAPSSISQLRESTACLTRYAKQTGTALFLIGHVTKEGALAGPRVLEHIVDTVIYFEEESDHRFRLIRAIKNRFGPANELGIFSMTEKGLREVHNPSAIFLSRPTQTSPGNLVTASWEGSRPLLVEVQALVDTTHLSNPRRVIVGLDHNRLAMLLAVLHRHGGVKTWDQDVFINIAGGVRLLETSADLPVLLAILSSLRNFSLPQDLVAFGEVGLSGEVRPVPRGQERLQVAAKQGFKRAIIPSGNTPKQAIAGLTCVPVSKLSAALSKVAP